jgi:hypothetical protein
MSMPVQADSELGYILSAAGRPAINLSTHNLSANHSSKHEILQINDPFRSVLFRIRMEPQFFGKLDLDPEVKTRDLFKGQCHEIFDFCARIYRPSFHENKPKTLVFSHTKRAFWACFRENWVYNFGHWFFS